MGQKDIAEKLLEEYNDVFADIANVFYFQGERRIKEDALENTKMKSQYKNQEDELHEQERDVGKFWRDGGMKIAYLAFENQTEAEKYMPLRVFSYDGAIYKEQLENKEQKEKFPSITLVLYFGMRPWTQSKSLKEVVKIPKGLEDYVNDYKIQVCEVAWLTDDQVALFQSDFRIVADFFVQKRKNKDYIPSSQKIKHVDAVLKLLSVFAKDERYKQALASLKHNKEDDLENEQIEYLGGEEISMCEIVDKFIKQGIEQGIEQKTIEVAISLMDVLEDDVIAEKVGLSLDVVKKLRQEKHESFSNI